MPTTRLTDRAAPPTPDDLAYFLGQTAFERWNQMLTRIDALYPALFAPDWIYGGAKHGWALRFKKSKSFCTLIPEDGRVSIQIVFGADERAKMVTTRRRLTAASRKAYDNARAFHDGKWLYLTLSSAAVVEDVFQMLAVKRKPRRLMPIA
ncbi:DUF3788 domain-containing protein [Opitutus terrae]|uniref:DUF3788 domain-containing protein n=1 Tax=Opitutus terrae (strain DSM 11246 / JCM 15787 / PB90-1) TaxID=452637 RepID=B1ZX09_OPITP|nr:DUF3788 domain-containing protein [Opitutus terrae]ACB75120.1 conserved hypothetical protein [Opitutus terrae PB90-1]